MLKESHRHSERLSFAEYVDYMSGKTKPTATRQNTHYVPERTYRRETSNVPSLGHGVGNAGRTEIPEYTGTYIKGISVTHKSNLVPVTSSEQARDISRMRR